MSGLVAVLSRSGRPVESGVSSSMLEALRHRGPDGSRAVSLPSALIGHAHFWTTPEETGEHQPVHDRTRRLTLAFDGRLDNRAELIKLLEVGAVEALDMSDAQIALRAYSKWGEGCFDRFLGPFAMVLYCGWERRLLCVRDHLGSRTLFYHADAQFLVVASEEAAVLAFPGLDNQLDEGGLAEFLAVDVYRQSGTFFKSISELPPASLLTVDQENVKLKTFGTPQPKSIRYRSDREYVEHFLELFERAVTCRMRASIPPAVLMSGGFDSTSVAAVAARELARRAPGQSLPTVSWVFDKFKQCDESGYIQVMQQRYGLETTLFSAEDHWPLHPSTASWWNPNAPDGNAYRALKQAGYQAASRQGGRVLLTGGMAGQLYTHEGNWLRDLVTEGHWLEAIRLMAKEANMRGLRGTIRSAARLTGRTVRAVASDQGESLSKPPWLTDHAWALLQPLERSAGQDWRRPGQFRRLFCRGTVGGVTKEIHNANRCRIELRRPFRDRRITYFFLGIPAHQLHRPGSFKHILRNAMQGLVPDPVLHRQQCTTLFPFYIYGLLQKERSLTKSILERPQTAWGPYVCRRWLSACLSGALEKKGDGAEAVVLWRCLALEMWEAQRDENEYPRVRQEKEVV